MKLADFTQGRDNNFNLIRIASAYAVLITHSFALAIGTGDAEPFANVLGMTIGSIAVDIFFLTSGFLVTASLLTRQCTIEFVYARFLRIFPALFVMLLLSVFGIGLFFTTISWTSYLTDPQIYRYFMKCLTVFSGIENELTGVFERNPYKNTVNGSLWTMPYELKMYALLSLIWIPLRVIPKFRLKTFKITIVSGALLAGLFVILNHLGITKSGAQFFRLFFMFFSGATFFILKERVVLSHSIFYISLAALLLAILNKQIFFFVYVVTLAYILFFVAYVPSGLVRTYNKLGD
ncbi:MAG: acyltransferase, partial [Desulfobulbaceae bacterium]|nr:acyltransferase [Desulfobulbaceae bacterium]